MGPINELAHILKNECVGPNLYVMELASPKIAGEIEAGQFVHMKIPNAQTQILRRPFSVYACNKSAHTIEILYQVVGVGTEHMTHLVPGACEDAELMGPIGRGWQPPCALQRALLVGGGVGGAPLYLLCEDLRRAGVRTDVILGAQTKAALVCRKRYEALHPASLRCSTDDGTFGCAGFCTILVEEALKEATQENMPYDYMAVCGPEPLMKAVWNMARAANIFCEVSLERRMACGIGACLSCAVDTVGGRRRACVDGPVFCAEEVVW